MTRNFFRIIKIPSYFILKHKFPAMKLNVSDWYQMDLVEDQGGREKKQEACNPIGS